MTEDCGPVSSVIRVFPDDSEYGQPYEYRCTCRHLDRDTVELMAVCEPPTPGALRAIRGALAEQDIKHAIFVFYRNGERCERHIATTPHKFYRPSNKNEVSQRASREASTLRRTR